MTIVVKKPNSEDRAAFVNLALGLTHFNQDQYIRHYDDFDRILKVRRERAQKIFDARNERKYSILLLAYLDDKPIGYARGYIHDHALHVGYCDEVYIDESARGNGAGKKLLDAMTLWMKEKGVIRFMLTVYAWNDAAQEFYKREGFASYALSYEKNISPERQ